MPWLFVCVHKSDCSLSATKYILQCKNSKSTVRLAEKKRKMRFLYSMLAVTVGVAARNFTIDGSAGDFSEARGPFCINYYGTISATVTVDPEAVGVDASSMANCRSGMVWDTPSTSGAVLSICGVGSSFSSSAGPALAVSLKQSTPFENEQAISQLSFQDFLITNSSMPGPFELDRVAANISGSAMRGWNITGTKAALNPKGYSSVSLDCVRRNRPRHVHCLDLDRSLRSSNSCFATTSLDWNDDGIPANFSFQFQNLLASADIVTMVKWRADTNGSSLNSVNSSTVFRFRGGIELPSIVDYDFWKNTTLTYEKLKKSETQLRWVPDKMDWPVMWNESNGAWYAVVNQTFGSSGAANMRDTMGLFGLGVVVMAMFAITSI